MPSLRAASLDPHNTTTRIQCGRTDPASISPCPISDVAKREGDLCATWRPPSSKLRTPGKHVKSPHAEFPNLLSFRSQQHTSSKYDRRLCKFAFKTVLHRLHYLHSLPGSGHRGRTVPRPLFPHNHIPASLCL